MSVTIKREIDEEEFWSSILGSTEFINEWWLSVRYRGDATWEVPGTVTLTIEGEDGEPVTKSLTIHDLVEAYEIAVSKPYYHCGNKIDIDDMDECASDIVLQIAMFGDVVYG